MSDHGHGLLERTTQLTQFDGRSWQSVLDASAGLARHHSLRDVSGVSLVVEMLSLLAGATGAAEPESTREQLAEPLSDSETRVLRYLPTGLTTAEIAGELYLSVNTVKTHLRHVYAKLGVHRRVAAVERARELGLLPGSSRKHGRPRDHFAPIFAAAGIELTDADFAQIEAGS